MSDPEKPPPELPAGMPPAEALQTKVPPPETPLRSEPSPWALVRVFASAGLGGAHALAIVRRNAVASALAAILLIFATSFSGLFSVVEGRLRDFDFFFNPADEGLIIVDAPQLFTRERLVNERLRESEWLDEQISLVDDKLEEDQFGRPDAIAITEQVLRIGAADNPQQPPERGSGKLPPITGDGDQIAGETFKILKEINGFKPSPRGAFDAARDFRERLSQQRYETILDDAHDLGENTLNRLNFHLTIAPARQSTDSLVAISVVMSEMVDRAQVLELYSKLMIELRKRMQEIVGQLFVDRSQMFDLYKNYRFEPTEESILNSIVDIELDDYLSDRNINKEIVVDYALSIFEKRRFRKLESDLKSDMERMYPPGFWNELFSSLANGKGTLLNPETETIDKGCQGSLPLMELLGRESGNKVLEIIERKSAEIILSKVQEENSSPHQGADGGRVSSSKASRDEVKRNITFVEAGLREPFKLRCWDKSNSALMSRLQLLGVLHHIQHFDTEATLNCNALQKAMVEVVRITMDDSAPATISGPLGFGDCDPLIKAASLIRSRIKATGAEIGHTGLAKVLTRYLMQKPMETTGRVRTLDSFFGFSIDNCTIERCSVWVRTKSEKRDGGLPATTALTIGQQEALRLFLELSCFADARSYTVWPRAGERDTTVETERASATGIFDGLWGRVVSTQTGSEMARRRDRDHIFGIGDWGKDRDRNSLKPCSAELMTVLEEFPIESDFIAWIKDKLQSNQRLKNWWTNTVIASCKKLELPNCETDIDLQTLADVVVQRRTTTSVGWIVAPRADGPGEPTRHIALALPLSAIVSLPSWWGRLKIDVTACWVRPRNLFDRIAPGSLCETAKGSQSHVIEIPLPGKAQDVLQKLGFFILRTPYLDVSQHDSELVEAGRKAQVRLIGGRLWKNPRVRLGSQWHDRIEVLPNMQGLIATFDCVEPSTDDRKQIARFDAGRLMSFGEASSAVAKPNNVPEAATSPDALSEPRSVQVWTSEGVTREDSVPVSGFRPRHFQNGEPEPPCWLNKSEKFSLPPHPAKNVGPPLEQPEGGKIASPPPAPTHGAAGRGAG